MTNKHLWIITRKNIGQQLIELRNGLVKEMKAQGYTVDEIASVVRLSKGGVSRVIRFGSNTNKKTVG